MVNHGIPLDKAELLSVLMEGILYGMKSKNVVSKAS